MCGAQGSLFRCRRLQLVACVYFVAAFTSVPALDVVASRKSKALSQSIEPDSSVNLKANSTLYQTADAEIAQHDPATRLTDSVVAKFTALRSAIAPIKKKLLRDPWLRCSAVSCYQVWWVTLGAIPFLFIIRLLVDKFRHVEHQERRFQKSVDEVGQPGSPGPGTCSEMLKHLSISKCGGLDVVPELVKEGGRPIRYFYAGFYVFYAGFNICFSLWTDSIFLASYLGWGKNLGQHDAALETYRVFASRGSLFTVDMAAAIEFIELFGLALLMSFFVYQVVSFLWFRRSEDNQYVAFRALEYAFDILVLLSYYSAIMPAGAVHPALIMRRFEQWMAAPSIGSVKSGWRVKAVQVAYFWVSRVLMAVTGLMAFGVKITLVSVLMNSPYAGTLLKLATLGSLMVQTLGSTVLHRVLKRELLWMIFGGQDTEVRVEEALMMDVYIALLYHKIYHVFWEGGKKLDFFALGITLDHGDMQRLLFVEQDTSKTLFFEKMKTHKVFESRKDLAKSENKAVGKHLSA